MVATGITRKGERLEFDCSDKGLVSLDIPEGVTSVRCSNNLLTELILLYSVTTVYCSRI